MSVNVLRFVESLLDYPRVRYNLFFSRIADNFASMFNDCYEIVLFKVDYWKDKPLVVPVTKSVVPATTS